MSRNGLGRARSVLLAILSVEVAVLVVTGVALFFLYRPSTSQAWSDVVVESTDWDIRVAQALRRIHRLASQLAVPTALATGVAVALGRESVRTWPRAATGAGIALSALVASFTGYLLPWDQLALWAVTVGSDMKGYRPFFNDTVRFVLIGGVEVSRTGFVRWLLLHMLVVGPALAILVAVGWRSHRSRSADAQSSSASLGSSLVKTNTPKASVATDTPSRYAVSSRGGKRRSYRQSR